jgi:pyruvate,water dikinase
VRGTVRVIRSLSEASKLQPSDVLIAVVTEPPWTPLFATASAIVTDTGGVLSYSAVVAREYRIPAVVGTGNATRTFQDGQLIEVDGNAGIVRVVIEETNYEPALAR